MDRCFVTARAVFADAAPPDSLRFTSAASGKTALMRLTRLLCLAVILFVPVVAFGQVDAVDLTSVFVAGGVTIDRLMVFQIGGIVLIRGRTDDPARAIEARQFAVAHGYDRVANLIEIVPGIGDAGIESAARHVLEMARQLDGCRFQLESTRGVIHLSGQVVRENQKEFAVHLVSRIDGVKEVQSALTLNGEKGSSATP